MSQILSTPWTPTLEGRVCTPYAPYDDLVDEGAAPNGVEDSSWTMKTLRSKLDAKRDGKAALWEGILALWRLKLCGTDGMEHENWRNLVLAWLHRHSDLCRDLDIPPFEVVLLYANTLHKIQRFPVQMIPSWDAPVAEPEPQSDPTPKPKRNQTRTQQSAIAVPQVSSEDADIEMLEATGPSVSVSLRKGKGRAQSQVSASASGSQQPESDFGEARSKRHGSPVQEQKSSKRIREGVEPKTPIEGVDLSKHTFFLGTEINLSLVPALIGMECSNCKAHADRNCVPIWHKNTLGATVRCHSCKVWTKRCDLGRMDCGIRRWPILKVQPKRPPLDVKEVVVAGPSNLNRRATVAHPSNLTPEEHPDIHHDVFISAPPMTTATSEAASAPAPAPSPSPAVVATPVQDRTFNSIFLHDVRPYERILSDPDSSRHYLKVKAAELRGVATREVSDAHTLANFIEHRADILMNLAKELSEAGSPAEQEEIEDTEDSIENSGNVEALNSPTRYGGGAGMG